VTTLLRSDPVGGVAAELESVAASLEALRAATLAPGALTRAGLSALRAPAADLLRRHEGFTIGAGVVFAPGALSDAERWIEWWWADRGAGLDRLEVDLDERSADFYDYTTAEWYREPARTGRAALAGPYVDYICTHAYTFTLALPLLRDGRFLGVAGADILAEEVERAVLPALAARPRTTVLASGDGRVIASNDARFAPGVVLRGGEGLRPVRRRLPAILPWTLLEAG
jgi:methyl-accepting chemotaxis protein-like sensor